MKKVIIYTTPFCAWCKVAKEYFTKHGVSYEEKHVASDAKAREEMIHKSGQMGVPVIEIGEDVVVGFNYPIIKDLLGLES